MEFGLMEEIVALAVLVVLIIVICVFICICRSDKSKEKEYNEAKDAHIREREHIDTLKAAENERERQASEKKNSDRPTVVLDEE